MGKWMHKTTFTAHVYADADAEPKTGSSGGWKNG
jgi:hypothetical protein